MNERESYYEQLRREIIDYHREKGEEVEEVEPLA